MAASSLKVLPHVLVRVPLACYPKVMAVCRRALEIIRSKENCIERVMSCWGAETLVLHAASSAAMVDPVLRWLASFPHMSFPENQRIQMECVKEESDILDILNRPPFKFAQLRISGPELESSKWQDKLPPRNFQIDTLDPINASPRLRDAWWSVARSIFEGTPLPASLTTLSFFSSFDSDNIDPSLYDSHDLRRGLPHKLSCAWFATVIWNGETCGLLTCDFVDFHPFPHCNIKVWGGVSSQWLHDAMMVTITNHVHRAHTFTSVCAGFQALSQQEIQSTWRDTWTFAKDSKWETYLRYQVNHGTSLYDETGDEGCDYLGEFFWYGGKNDISSCPFCYCSEKDVKESDIDIDIDILQQVHDAASLVERDMEATQKTDADKEHVAQVLTESVQTALQDEQASLVEVMMRSKADAPLTSDGFFLGRFKRVGNLKDVVESLLSSDHLIEPISRVFDAGCEVRPAWTLALLLVPLTQAQVDELGVELSVHHVIAHESDKEPLIRALKVLPSRKRVSIVMPPTSPVIPPPGDDIVNSRTDVPVLEIERTFLQFHIPKDVSEGSNFAYTAPCGDENSHQPANPRRWGEARSAM